MRSFTFGRFFLFAAFASFAVKVFNRKGREERKEDGKRRVCGTPLSLAAGMTHFA